MKVAGLINKTSGVSYISEFKLNPSSDTSNKMVVHSIDIFPGNHALVVVREDSDDTYFMEISNVSEKYDIIKIKSVVDKLSKNESEGTAVWDMVR